MQCMIEGEKKFKSFEGSVCEWREGVDGWGWSMVKGGRGWIEGGIKGGQGGSRWDFEVIFCGVLGDLKEELAIKFLDFWSNN